MRDLGVVDPLRVPAPVVDAVARLRRLPALAQAFIALAILDALARTLGLIEPAVGGDPFRLFASYVPRDAWILLPAIVLIRRRTAAGDTPWIHRGALLVALVTLLARPTVAFLGNALPADSVEPQIALGALEVVLTGIAVAVLGFGIASLDPKEPPAVIAGLANLAGFAVMGGIVVELLAGLAGAGRIDLVFTAPWWSYAGAILRAACVAYLARAVVRGLDDPGRARLATRVAASGALIWAAGWFAEGAVSAMATLTRSFTLAADAYSASGLLQIVGPLLIVIAFGLGVGDPLRPLPKEWEAVSQR